MANNKVSVVVGCVALWSVLGCGEAGVTGVAPIPAGAGGTTPRAGTAGATSVTPPTGMAMMPVTLPPTAAATAGAASGLAAGTGAVAAAGTGAAPSTGGTSAAATAGTMAATAAGTSGAAGTGATETAGAMATAGAPAAGTGAPAAPGPCPAGWTCMDVGVLMLDAKDQNGNPITTTCGNGMLAECNDADPASSCPMLTNPFCAHLEFAGMPVVSCGAPCTP